MVRSQRGMACSEEWLAAGMVTLANKIFWEGQTQILAGALI
jgi:hypothetical protein